MEELVRPGAVVVDAGARWGVYTWLFARLVGPTGHVHVFEPNPEHAATLRRLARSNVTVHGVGLSDEPGDAVLHVPIVAGERLDGLASVAPPSGRADGVATISIRLERLDALGLEGVTFMKCDVEGHELAVLRGAEATLRERLPSLLVEVEQRHSGADPDATFEYLGGLGYSGYAVFANGLRPLAEFDVERDQAAFLRGSGADGPTGWAMPSDYVHDFLFVHPGTSVERLLAPRRSVP